MIEFDEPFFNIENYDFKFFLEGIEIPIQAARIQIGRQFSFSVDIAPADFDFKALSWGILIFRKNNEPWKVACHGLYIGHGISKTLSSKKYNLKFVSVKYIFDTIRFLDLLKEGKHNPYAFHDKTFIGDTSMKSSDLDNSETLKANLLTQLTSILSDGTVSLPDEDDQGGILGPSASSLKKSDNSNQEKEATKSDLKGFVEWIFSAYTNNDFSKQHLKAFHFKDNFAKVIKNEKIDVILGYHLVSYVNTTLQGEDSNIILNRILSQILSMFKYDAHFIPSGLKSGEDMVIKPMMHLGIPPACNIMFPHETYSYNFNKDYQQVPTRFRLHTFFDQNDAGRYFYSPRTMNLNDVAETRGKSPSGGNDEILGKSADSTWGELEKFEVDTSDGSASIGENEDMKLLTNEERFRNIIPAFRKHQNQEIMPTGIFEGLDVEDEDIDEEAIKNSAAITDYMFHEERYKGIGMNINLKLKFGLLPGFCGAVLDTPNSLVGHINSVSHFIDLEAPTGGTSVQMNFLKKDNVPTPVVSGWYEEEMFMPDKIDSFFSELGTKTFYKNEDIEPVMVEEIGSHWIGLKESLDELYDHYRDMPRISESMSRELPTAKEFLETMGLTLNEDAEIEEKDDNNPFNIEVLGTEVSKERKEAVKEYMDNLREETTYGYSSSEER